MKNGAGAPIDLIRVIN